MNDLITGVVARLCTVKGVAAVALGGSFARGLQGPDSDIDLSIYYEDACPFSVQDIVAVATEVNDIAEPTVTDFGRWGRWVNGGVWLTTQGQPVDFLYRSLDDIGRVVTDCQLGHFESDFYQQPPYGFHSYVYLGELSYCRILYDPQGALAQLKKRIALYPERLKSAIINRLSMGGRIRSFSRREARRAWRRLRGSRMPHQVCERAHPGPLRP